MTSLRTVMGLILLWTLLFYFSPIIDANSHKFTMTNGQIADARWIKENHEDCCGEKDCFPIKAGQLKFTPKGWKVEGTSGYVPVERVRYIPQDVLDKNLPNQRGPWYCVFENAGFEGWSQGLPLINCLFLVKPKG